MDTLVLTAGKMIWGGNRMVTLYTSDTCGICRMVKMKLEKKGIPYQNEKNVDALLKKGIQRLPVLQLEDGSMMENISDINNWVNAQ